MPNLDNETILLAITAVIGLALLLQTIILLAIFLSLRKAARSLHDEVEDLRSSVMPIIYATREAITRFTPKIEGAVDDLAGITQSLRVQTTEMQASANEVIERLRSQLHRLDGMITSVLDAADRAGGFVIASVSKPVRQLSGVMASIKAVLETLRTPTPRRP
jgi:methyl-accepting chemotaxis protein